MRRILMIYDRFPPFNVSGSARPFRFAKHLPEFGYLPTVIAVKPELTQEGNREILGELDPNVTILRSPPAIRPTLTPLVEALAERKRRRETKPTADPPSSAKAPSKRAESESSRWTTQVSGLVLWSLDWHLDWCLPSLRLATRAARQHSYDLVWASAPHSRNAFAGYVVSKRLGLPLVLDQRDPWTYGSNWRPRLPRTGRLETWWAEKILRHAQRVVFTSPLTQAEMQARFPEMRAETITNGFDRQTVEPLRDLYPDKCLFRYTGVLNDRRVPDVLLQGLAIAARDPELSRDVRLEFVGGMAGHEGKIGDYGVEPLVSLRGHVPKRTAERLIFGSDVNVLLQTITTGQDVIAGKVFDYLAAKKPILAIVSKTGGDAWLLEKTGSGSVVSFDDPEGVASAIRELWQRWRAGQREVESVDLEPFSSRALTGRLAEVFDEVLSVAIE